MSCFLLRSQVKLTESEVVNQAVFVFGEQIYVSHHLISRRKEVCGVNPKIFYLLLNLIILAVFISSSPMDIFVTFCPIGWAPGYFYC